MKSITVLLTLIALSFPTLVTAKVWQQTFTVEYALGEPKPQQPRLIV